jgi:tripartite-type tricarboxylate transporter receptor subunit TctC
VTNTPDEFGKLIREDVARWAKVIKQRGIKLE